jgi:polyhydroxyalkanoate synthase
MADPDTQPPEAPPLPSLEEMQHWTWVMGRAQQMMLEHVAKAMGEAAEPKAPALPWMNLFGDPAKIAQQQADMWTEGLARTRSSTPWRQPICG